MCSCANWRYRHLTGAPIGAIGPKGLKTIMEQLVCTWKPRKMDILIMTCLYSKYLIESFPGKLPYFYLTMHQAIRNTGLSANNMNVYPGGKQALMRDTEFNGVVHTENGFT